MQSAFDVFSHDTNVFFFMLAEGAQESQNPSDVGSGEVQIPKPQFQQQTGIVCLSK